MTFHPLANPFVTHRAQTCAEVELRTPHQEAPDRITAERVRPAAPGQVILACWQGSGFSPGRTTQGSAGRGICTEKEERTREAAATANVPDEKNEDADESACKPDSVPGRLAAVPFGDHPSGLAVTDKLKRPTRGLGRATLERPRRHLPVPSWPCSGWGLPSHPGHPGCWWSLTPPFHPYPVENPPGGLFSVALSRGSPRVAVSNHPALWSPDFPRWALAHRGRLADSSAPSEFTQPSPNGPEACARAGACPPGSRDQARWEVSLTSRTDACPSA